MHHEDIIIQSIELLKCKQMISTDSEINDIAMTSQRFRNAFQDGGIPVQIIECFNVENFHEDQRSVAHDDLRKDLTGL
jgi:hypothetical protein